MQASGDRFDSPGPPRIPQAATINIQPETVERLRQYAESAESSGREIAGFLLGSKLLTADRKRKRFETVFSVDAFLPVSDEFVSTPFFSYSKQNAAALRRQLQQYAGRRKVLGFFRSNRRATCPVSGEDLDLIADQFGGDGILLLIDVGSEPLSGAFYTFDPSKPSVALETKRVSFAPADTARADREFITGHDLDGGDDDQALARSFDAGSFRETARRSRPADYAKWVLVAAFVLGVLALGVAQYRTMRLLEGRQAESVRTPTTALDLRTERAGAENQWALYWNQASAVVRNATRAHLSIRDGYLIKELDLTKAELDSGRLLFTPTAEDVSFRLEVFDLERGKSTSEAIRVLAKPWPGNDLYSPDLAALRNRLSDLDRDRAVPARPRRERDEEVNREPEERAGRAAKSAPAEPAPSLPKKFTPPAYRQPVIVSRAVDDAPSLPLVQPGTGPDGRGGPVRLPQAIASVPAAPPPPDKGQSRPKQESAALRDSADANLSKAGESTKSSLEPAKLLQRVEPKYPAGASRIAMKGSVVVEGTIGVDGRLHDLRPVSGHTMLAAAAIDAIKEWRYRPALLNGRPIAAPTTIQVNFNGTSDAPLTKR